MPIISHIGISQIAGECYSFNTPPIACQGAWHLMRSSQFMIFKSLPLIPQYFEQPGSCTNPTKEVSHISTFKYHLLYLFWFSTSLALWAFLQQKLWQAHASTSVKAEFWMSVQIWDSHGRCAFETREIVMLAVVTRYLLWTPQWYICHARPAETGKIWGSS